MRIGNFLALVPEGREHGSGHVSLSHGTVYTVRLQNCGSLRCDAELTIDGKDLGSYRLNGGQSWTLERSHLDAGRFTFFRADSAEGTAAEAGKVAPSDRGLIVVRFKPEKPQPVRPVGEIQLCSVHPAGPAPAAPASYDMGGTLYSAPKGIRGSFGGTNADCCVEGASPTNAQAGVTGLTGHSSQRFATVANLDYDPAGEAVISLRLVEEAGVRPLAAAPPRANATPAPVG